MLAKKIVRPIIDDLYLCHAVDQAIISADPPAY